MVLSKSSAFGYWAAFLSDALVIRPHYDWQEMIKENKKENNYFEIKWNEEENDSNLEFKNEIIKRKSELSHY